MLRNLIRMGDRTGGTGAEQVLVKERDGDRYFIASSAVPGDTNRAETLVFPAEADFQVTSYAAVCGGVGMTRAEALDELDAYVAGEAEPDVLARHVEAMGGEMGAMLGALQMTADDAVGRSVVESIEDPAFLDESGLWS